MERSPTSSLPSILITLATMTSGFSATNHTHIGTENSIWYDVGEVTGLLLKTCLDTAAIPKSGMEFLDIFQNCLRRKSLLVLNRSLRSDVISIGKGIQLVKYRDANFTQSDRYSGRGSSRSIRGQIDWNNEVSQRLFDLFDTHELKIDLNSDDEGLPRHRGRRRKDNMMVSLLVFAMIAVGLIVIPMGFQFLAVLGGKALLLAKLALILSSIQGLKKIATSSFNYGLYSSPHSAPGNPWDGEEKWNYPQFSSGGMSGMSQGYNYPQPHHDQNMMYHRNSYKRNDEV